MNGLLIVVHDACRGVWRRLSGVRAPAYEIRSSGVLGVVDGVADLTRYMAEVPGVTLFGLGFAALLDHPHQAYTTQRSDDNAGEEAGGKGSPVET